MATVFQVADYFLGTSPRSDVTNLKLQKLCAYTQAVNIAYKNEEIFNDPIEMWQLGPVIPSLYQKYKEFKDSVIPRAPLNLDSFSMQERLILAAINSYYGNEYSAERLCALSHQDFPGELGSRKRLTKEMLREAFANNPVVQLLRRATKQPILASAGYTLSEKEFWDAISA